MGIQTRLAVVAGVSLMVALGGCSDSSSSSSSDEGGYSGPPPCSDYSNGEILDEKIELAGCEGEAVSINDSSVCDGHSIIAVGPVYGFVGKPANYLGEGVDATKSQEWKKFKQTCSWKSE